MMTILKPYVAGFEVILLWGLNMPQKSCAPHEKLPQVKESGFPQLALAQLGERQTEDLKVLCSIHSQSIYFCGDAWSAASFGLCLLTGPRAVCLWGNIENQFFNSQDRSTCMRNKNVAFICTFLWGSIERFFWGYIDWTHTTHAQIPCFPHIYLPSLLFDNATYPASFPSILNP